MALDVEWLEVIHPGGVRRVNVHMARRMAQLVGEHVIVPWCCWRIVDAPQEALPRRQKGGRRHAAGVAADAQLELT